MLEVHIDKGMKNGQQIPFRGESDQAPGVQTGDVIIVVNEKPHPRFVRQENNLIVQREIDLLTALAGGEFAIKHLDDRALIVQIVPGEIINHGDIKMIREQGMPSPRHHELGDLYIKLSVKFPPNISPDAIQLLERALSPRAPTEKFPKNILLEEVHLEEPDHRSKVNLDAMDEDEPGEPRVQCANQ